MKISMERKATKYQLADAILSILHSLKKQAQTI